MRVPLSEEPPDAAPTASKKLYRILGVTEAATPGELKRAYHKLALRFHPDKNPGQGERFNEIAAAYTVLSDPRKKQLYDQFGEQGVQLAEQAAQHGLPPWLLTPRGHCLICTVLLSVVAIVLVLLPLFVLLRADASITWPWVVVLIPLWLANLAYAIGLGAAIWTRTSDDASQRGSITRAQGAYATAQFGVLVAFEVLLALKLDRVPPASLSFLYVVIPLLLTLLPATLKAARALITSAYRRARPSEGQPPPPTCAQLTPVATKLAGQLLLACTIVLVALHADGAIDWSWWLVLLPTWVHFGLLAHAWQSAVRQQMRTKDGTDEERAAKTVALGLAFLVGLLGLACFLLLSLRWAGKPTTPRP